MADRHNSGSVLVLTKDPRLKATSLEPASSWKMVSAEPSAVLQGGTESKWECLACVLPHTIGISPPGLVALAVFPCLYIGSGGKLGQEKARFYPHCPPIGNQEVSLSPAYTLTLSLAREHPASTGCLLSRSEAAVEPTEALNTPDLQRSCGRGVSHGTA